jgi:O-antigen/teichoic acid export membrane protein
VFGVASLALAFLEILTETGINVFLIQEKEDLKEYVNTAWIISIIRGSLISLLIIILAPMVASFFRSPDSLKILYLISIVPFLRGFINPAEIKFQKNLEFKKEFLFRFVIFFIDSAIAIYTAFITKSAISMVWGLIAGVILEIALSFIFIKLKPKLFFEWEKLKKLFNRGKWITGYGIFNYLFEHGDDITIGRLLSTGELGVYQVAYRISIMPLSEVSDIFSKVIFPIYVKILPDKKRLLKAYFRITLMISVIVIPFALIFYLFPRQLVLMILGEQWLEAAKILKILSAFGAIRAILNSNINLFLAVKKQEYVTACIFAGLLGLAVTIIPFVKRWGIIGAGYSALTATIISVPVYVFYVLKVFKDARENV